jgi:hypothetical protein
MLLRKASFKPPYQASQPYHSAPRISTCSQRSSRIQRPLYFIHTIPLLALQSLSPPNPTSRFRSYPASRARPCVSHPNRSSAKKNSYLSLVVNIPSQPKRSSDWVPPARTHLRLTWRTWLPIAGPLLALSDGPATPKCGSHLSGYFGPNAPLQKLPTKLPL